MKRIDLVIGATLVVAAIASAAGVASYKDDRVGAFVVDWSTRDVSLDAPPLSQTGGGDLETAIDVTAANITRAAWVVTVAGAAARVQPVAIRVEIVSPTNASVSAEGELPAGPGASVDLPLELDLASVPVIERASGPTLDAVRGALNATQSSTLGVGVWTIRASIAPTTPGPLGGAESFTVTPALTLTVYEAVVSTDAPEVTRG